MSCKEKLPGKIQAMRVNVRTAAEVENPKKKVCTEMVQSVSAY
jgi:hypothetical protein